MQSYKDEKSMGAKVKSDLATQIEAMERMVSCPLDPTPKDLSYMLYYSTVDHYGICEYIL